MSQPGGRVVVVHAHGGNLNCLCGTVRNVAYRRIPKHLFTMATGGQRVMWCGYWPISRQHGDVMPSSSHGKMHHEIHLYSTLRSNTVFQARVLQNLVFFATINLLCWYCMHILNVLVIYHTSCVIYHFWYHRAAFGTYLLSIALFVVNVRWGALHMLTTGMHKFQLYNADIE